MRVLFCGTNKADALLVFFAVSSFTWVKADSAVDAVNQKHLQSYNAVQNIQCKVTVSYFPELPSGNYLGLYKRLGSDVLISSRNNVSLSVFSRISGVAKVYTTYIANDSERSSEGTITNESMPVDCDAFSYGLLTFYGNQKYRVPLTELFEERASIHSCAEAILEGKKMVCLDISHQRANQKIYFDPSVNFLVNTVLHRDLPRDAIIAEVKVLEFKEVDSGVFFPRVTQCTYINEKTGKREIKWKAEISEIKVNPNILRSDLRLKFPKGCIVSDHITNKICVADDDGNPTEAYRNAEGKEVTLTKEAPLPVTSNHTQGRSQTQVEPSALSSYILPFSGLLTFVLICIWVYKRRT